MATLEKIEGIGPEYRKKLGAAGIGTAEALLEAGANPKGRRELAARTGVSSKRILRWVNHADLFRIKGIAGQFAELLEAAGVDTVAELSQRNGANLHAKLDEINATKKLVRKVPGQAEIDDLIGQAKVLEPVVEY